MQRFQARRQAQLQGSNRDCSSKGVVLPVVLTLLVQAVVSMSAVAIPVLMPEAAGELNIPASYVGILMSLIYLGATAIVPVSGYFISRFGPIGVSQICLVLSAVGLGAVSIPSLPVMLSGAVLMGIGYGPVTPASSHVLVRTTPISILAIVFSIKQTGVPLGGALAGAIVPQLVVLCGWKISALWVAGFNIVLALFLLPFRKRFDTEISSRTIFSWKNAVEPVKMTLLQPELRQLGVTSFFFSTMQLCLVSFLVTFLIERIEMTLIQAGVLLSAAQASGIIGRILWGGLADRFVNPRIMLGFLGLAMTVCAFGTALFSSDWSFPAILIVCTLFGATAVGWNGVYLAEVARVAKPELAGMATGGTLFFTFLGILLGLPTFSLIVETTGSYPLAFVIVALTTLVCGLRLLFARTPH